MRADERALTDLAASVADGDLVDWGAAEARSTAAERRLVRHLRLVDRIATLHRTIPPEAEDDVQPANPRLSQPEPSGPRWGRLVVLDPIGRGTSGEVFRAWDSDLHRDVALKLLKSDGDAEAEAHARVLQEARRLARIRHPHVVHVYGAEQHEQRVGLWMELVRGESLDEIVRTRGPLGAAEASIVGRDLASAIASVHAAGLLHRDLKAQNVVRESGGRIVLMDFGTGEELRDARGSARLTGTPLYLAPELFTGGRASVHSDLYSLGVLLFFLVTGEYPVTADSHEGLARAHRERRARRLRDLRPDLPHAFVAAVERALAPDPAARFRTAGEMEAALREVADARGSSTDAGRPAGGQRWWAAAAIVLLCASLAASFWSRRSDERPPSDAATGIDSLAVLPLADVSGVHAQPQLAEALTDQLIATLGQIRSLRVAARTSVMPFQSSGRTASEIAQVLGVDALVEGTVAIVGDAASGGRVRVNARLIAAGSGAQLWSRSLERPLGDTLRLQAELAQEIARAVRATLTPGESQRLAQTHATSAQAEQAYFQGRYHLGQYGVQRARRALESFNRAVQLDPNHAAARAGAARSYFALGSDGALSEAEARTRALDEITRATAIDPDQPDALVALGDLKFRYDWDWAGAEAAFQRAIEVNGSFSYARGQFSRFLAAAGRLDESVKQAETAAELDPLSAETVQTLGLALYYKRDFAGAVRSLERALELDPRSARAHAVLSRVRDAQGEHAAAIAEMRRAMELAEEPGAAWRMQLIRLHAAAGRRDEARAQWSAFRREAERRRVRIAAEHLGYLYLTLGDEEQALAHLERAVDERDSAVLWLAVDPRVDPLRQHPRFRALVAKLGVP